MSFQCLKRFIYAQDRCTFPVCDCQGPFDDAPAQEYSPPPVPSKLSGTLSALAENNAFNVLDKLAEVTASNAILLAENSKLKGQLEEAVTALEYWLPNHRPFDGYIGSNDPKCKAHNEQWEHARNLLSKLKEAGS